MKKSLLILVVAVAVMLMAAPAMALQVHGGWSTSTEGCADCHVTHAADAAFLLKSNGGSTQTDACYACHEVGVAASPYDVENGLITSDFDYNRTPSRTDWTTASVRPSFSGGFAKSYDFDNHDEIVGSSAAVTANLVNSRSAHNVETIVVGESGGVNDDPWTAGVIPGGSVAVPNNVFKCGGCHDPHGNDAQLTTGGMTVNARLLRHTLPKTGVNPVAANNVTITVSAATYVATGYGSDVNNWCAGCHEVFNAADNSGHTADGNLKFRHAMGIGVNTDPKGGSAGNGFVAGAKIGATALGKGTPTSTDGDKLMCLSCHRAHGTGVTNASSISNSWRRYTDGGGATGQGAALLRLKNRDVCYNCHGGATANKSGI